MREKRREKIGKKQGMRKKHGERYRVIVGMQGGTCGRGQMSVSKLIFNLQRARG